MSRSDLRQRKHLGEDNRGAAIVERYFRNAHGDAVAAQATTIGHPAAIAGGLAIDFKSTPRMTEPLEHYQYDTFIARFTDRNIEPAYVTFGLDADGKVDHVTLKPVSPLANFSFDYQDLSLTPAATPPAP